MSIDIIRRMERFSQEFGSQNPADWSLGALDQAREALLGALEDRHFHFKIVEDAISAPGASAKTAANPVLKYVAATVHGSFFRHRYDMPEAMKACYLDYARAALESGDGQNALQAVERVLGLDPLNPPANALLAEICGRGLETQAKGLRTRLHLRHLRSFGKGRLSMPSRLAVHAPSASILVSDIEQPHITVFSLSGRCKRTLDLQLSVPVGLTPDGADAFLVCDLGNRRLVGFDAAGRVTQTLAVRQKDAALCGIAPAVAHRLGPDSFSLLAVDAETRQQVWLGVLTPQGFVSTVDLPEYVMFTKAVEDGIVFRGHNTGKIYSANAAGGSLRELPPALPRLARHYGFAPSRQGWFMDFTGKQLAKYSPEGALEFVADLEKLFGPKTHLMDMEVFEHEGRELLCIMDLGNACVHLFEVEEKPDGPEPA